MNNIYIPTIFDLISTYGRDLSSIKIDICTFKPTKQNLLDFSDNISIKRISNIDIFTLDLRDITLPNDSEFFQKIIEKSISNCLMPEMDYSNYNFNDILIKKTIFTENSILPITKNFFQEIRNKDISGTTLPKGDFSDYDFNNVILCSSIFYEGTILPTSPDFIKNLYNSSIWGCTLPSNDYSNIDFTDVDISNTTFGENSILPHNPNLFNNLKFPYIYEVTLPKDTLNNIHLYDIEEETLRSLSICNNISLESFFLLKTS